MSSVNQHPTFSYSQPSEYHFSHDSVLFARWLAESCETSPQLHVLDLCSGCGILGMDFLFQLSQLEKPLPHTCDFLEVQADYLPHYQINLQRLWSSITEEARATDPLELEVQSQLFLQNYAHGLGKKYDLIISNPPYFFKDQGTLSPSEFKNRCRFFLDSDFSQFLLFLKNHLTQDGSAYFLMRSQEQHGVQLESFFAMLGPDCHIVKVTEIRGTLVFQLTFI